MKNKKTLLKIFIYLCLLGYIGLTAFLIYHSSLDGSASSNASGQVGGEIADIIDQGQDKTKLKEPKSVFIKNPITEAKIGDSHTLEVEITPADSSYKSLTFTSSDSKIATVNKSGTIKFLAKGTVVISVCSTDFNKIKDDLTIEVKEIELIDFSVSLHYNDKQLEATNNIYELNQYQSYNLSFVYNPENATNKNVEYTYDETYISITNGVINALKPTTTPIEVIMAIGEYKNIIRIKVIEEILLVEPNELVISNPITEAKVGNTHTLKVSILPKDATYKSVVYKSSDTKIATVSTSGKITFKNSGTVTIYISSKDFPNVKTEMTVEVTKIQLEDFTYGIYDGETLLEPVDGIYNLKQYHSYSISTEFTPSNASLKTISYSYSTKGIVSVSKGILNALKPTEEPVKVTMKCDGIEKTFKVLVEEEIKEIIPLESLTVTKNEVVITVGQKIKLSTLGIKYTPTDVTNKTLSYTSSDEKILDIDSSNLIGKSDGNVTLTIEHTESGKKVEVKVIVNNIIKLDSENPYSIVQNYLNFENGKYIVRNGYSGNIHLNFDENSTFTTVSYSSSNTSVITVGNDGVFSPVDEGEAVITLTIDDGILEPIIYNVVFVVKNPDYTKVEGFNINNQTIELYVGDKVRLSNDPFEIVFIPEDATNKNLSYKSNDTKIVKIESAIIKAISAGTTTITVYNSECNISKEVQIIVKNIISINNDKPFTMSQEHLKYNKDKDLYTIRNGASAKLKINFNDDTTFKEVIYSSSNESVLTVGSDGIVTPKKVGKAVITVTIDDGMSEPIIYTINVEVERTPIIEDFSAFLHKVRKSIGHFGAFLVLGIMGSFGLLLMFDKKKWLFSIPLNIALGFGVAGLTEFIQTKVPGRYGCWEDVWLDFSGYMTSTAFLTLGILTVYLIIYLKNRKNRSEV